MNTAEYLKAVKGRLEKTTRNRKSKVAEAILATVKESMQAKEPTTVRAIAESLGKTIQQIHATVKKSNLLRKEKVNGRTLIVPSENTLDDTEELVDNR